MSKFRLTASVLASYFKHRCDRLFRYNTVPSKIREKAGDIGWRVPKKVRQNTRPGVILLMQGGDNYEIEQIEQLIETHGPQAVYHAGFDPETGKILSLSFTDFITVLYSEQIPRFIAQVEFDFETATGFDPSVQESLLHSVGLDPAVIQLTTARPDLIEVIHPQRKGDALRLRIWDFKASRKPRHEHYVQIAFYTLLLEHILNHQKIVGIEVDTQLAIVRTRQKEEEFNLTPYRSAVLNFLRNHVPHLLATPAAEAHFHYVDGCMLCEYGDHCRAEAEAGSDLSRVSYMSSVSKRRLNLAGIRNHRELAALHSVPQRITELRRESHNLSANLNRYVTASQTLEDGQIRRLGTKNLLMPRSEDIRIVLSAEQDAVTATCFALGIKTFEWDKIENKPAGTEEVFISAGPTQEGTMLLSFLHHFNSLLARVDDENRQAATVPVPADQLVADLEQQISACEQALATIKAQYPRLYRKRPEHLPILDRRDELNTEIDRSKDALKQAKASARAERRNLQQRLHIYIYDGLDLLILKECLERHILSDEPIGLLNEVKRLIRLFPPESLLPDAETFRTVPGTVISQVLRQSLTLPIAYGFDLASVSNALQPHRNSDGEAVGYVYRPGYGFGWPYSNQVAFERIHDVWYNNGNGRPFKPDPNKPERDMQPPEIRQRIDDTVRNKLRATDSVIRGLREVIADELLLRKEAFRLYETFDPSGPIREATAERVLDVMDVFTVLEESFAELAVKHIHTLPAPERAAKFECIRGLHHVNTIDGLFEFTFDPECRDVKFEQGDYNLVITAENNPDTLIIEVDGQLFRPAGWVGSYSKVTLEQIDVRSTPPRLWLRPNKPDRIQAKIDAGELTPAVLDRLYTDYNSHRVRHVINQLKIGGQAVEPIYQLLASGTKPNWQPFVKDSAAVEAELVSLTGKTRQTLLNQAQWRAVSGIMDAPLGLVWGPPGTGKTHTVAHILLCYALAARRQNKPIRVLVAAFTHHAIANVLVKTIELATKYGLSADILSVFKVEASGTNTADSELPPTSLLSEKDIAGQLTSDTPCVIIGATVWAVYKAMKEPGVPQEWFDVVLVDEASQMKLSDALIALATSKPSSTLLLAGDDKQLPPIIHGTYAEEHQPVLSSVFAFMRHRLEQLTISKPEALARSLFQLEENFRMNEPLTAYPREVIYGTYTSTNPIIRIALRPSAVSSSTDRVIDFLLAPKRPVLLVRYTPSVSYTARNPIEAELITQAVTRLANQILTDEGQIMSADEFAAEGVAVLAPHRAQNSAIRQALTQAGFGTPTRPRPLVDTVEKMQGKEREVIFVSYGVADEEYAEAEATFLLSQNRFNVAVTRAKRKLIVFCADPVIDVVPTDRQTLLDATMLKEFKNYCSDGQQKFTVEIADAGSIDLTVHWKEFDSKA